MSRLSDHVLSTDGRGMWHLMPKSSRTKMVAYSTCWAPVLPRPPENPVLKPFLTCMECVAAALRMVP